MHHLVPASPEMTLADLTAQSLAQAWSRDKSLLPDFSHKGDTTMDLIFKVQVAIFLQGVHLARWIQAQGGLTTLAFFVWPHLFQRLLTSVYQEVNKAHDGSRAIKMLNDVVQKYVIDYRQRDSLKHVLHRLGMTYVFCHEDLKETEKTLLGFYWYQQDRLLCFDGKKWRSFFPFLLYCKVVPLQSLKSETTFIATAPTWKKGKKNGAER